jgi:hypothetical protein
MKQLPVLLMLGLLAVSLIQGCTKAYDSRQKAEDNAREAAFRYWFVDIAKPSNMNAYYLSFGPIHNDIDPSDEFMKRFEGHEPPVKKASQCEYSRSSVRDRITGKIGLLFWATGIKWVNSKEIEVNSGWYLDGLGASGCVLHIVLENKRWWVTDRRECWES